MFSTITFFLVLIMVQVTTGALDAHYYDRTCPQAEKIVSDTIRNASMYDPKVPARILRMFFHDCFIRGCDASVLLDSTPSNKAEKDGPPNISLRAFYAIDDAKAKLEMACPLTVSCADIIAIAARDVVVMAKGPYWSVLKGRKDGKISKASETLTLPAPSFNTSQLIRSFAKRGLGIKDLVALSGGHTIGFSHCASFVSRLHNFSLSNSVDPSMDFEFSNTLKEKCLKPNPRDPNTGVFLDPTSTNFDNVYYKRIVEGKGVFGSDQALFGDYRTRSIVESFGNDQGLFFKEFVGSMVKLGNVGVLEKGEVRVTCGLVNKE